MKVSKENRQKYSWGNNCLGWHLVNEPELSVIQESMPPQTEEVKHKHSKSQQFFYVLRGTATFIIDGQKIIAAENEGIHIDKNSVHQIKNESRTDLEFLVISQPHSHSDRIVID